MSLKNYVAAGSLLGSAKKKESDAYMRGNLVKSETAKMLDRIQREKDFYNNVMGTLAMGVKAADLIINDPLDLNPDTDTIYSKYTNKLAMRMNETRAALQDYIVQEGEEPDSVYASQSMRDTYLVDADEAKRLDTQYKALQDTLASMRYEGGDWYINNKPLDYGEVQAIDKLIDLKKYKGLTDLISGL